MTCSPFPHDDLPPVPAAIDDPARVSLPSTVAAASDLTGDALAAYWRGVELGRTEAAQQPDALVLLFEPNAGPNERHRLASLFRSVRGIAAVTPAAGLGEREPAKEDPLEEIQWAADQLRPFGVPGRLDFGGAGQAIRTLLTAVDRLSHNDEPGQASGEELLPAVRSCVAVLVTDPAGRVALIESVKPGRAFELPGGGVKSGESTEAAAAREVAEEMGLQVAALTDMDLIAGLTGTPKPGATYQSRILVYRARAEGDLRAGSDAKSAAWWTAADVLHLADFGMLSDLATTHDVLLPWARER